jgi:hypothetical protein
VSAFVPAQRSAVYDRGIIGRTFGRPTADYPRGILRPVERVSGRGAARARFRVLCLACGVTTIKEGQELPRARVCSRGCKLHALNRSRR